MTIMHRGAAQSIPWAKRGRIVREAWLDAARLKLAAPDNLPKT